MSSILMKTSNLHVAKTKAAVATSVVALVVTATALPALVLETVVATAPAAMKQQQQ